MTFDEWEERDKMTVRHRWSAEPQWNDRSVDEWPYPDSFVRSEPSEALAQAVRDRVGASEDAGVTLVTRCVSGGYSEYTQENDYSTIVEVDGDVVFDTGLSYQNSTNGLTELLAWLDEDDQS